MKNKEKYADFLIEAMSVRGYSFGVDKKTGVPKVCASYDIYTPYHVTCENCALYKTCASSCLESRKKWLEEEFDPWSEFRDLKKGDIILIKKWSFWYPVVFIKLDDLGIYFTWCMVKDVDLQKALQFEDDPSVIKKYKEECYYES